MKDERMKATFKVIGLVVEKYVSEYEDLDYIMNPCEDYRYILYLMGTYAPMHGFTRIEHYKVTLESSAGPCGSGYCMSSYGYMCTELISKEDIGPLTHKPKENTQFDAYIMKLDGRYYDLHPIENEIEDDEYDLWETYSFGNVFRWSPDGGDSYYPSGFVAVNMDLFEEIKPRSMEKRPMWILAGPSGLGKSTLAMQLKNHYSVYETDSSDKLPDVLPYDVVVLGNRSGFTVDDIKKRLFGDPQLIVVRFEKEDE